MKMLFVRSTEYGLRNALERSYYSEKIWLVITAVGIALAVLVGALIHRK